MDKLYSSSQDEARIVKQILETSEVMMGINLFRNGENYISVEKSFLIEPESNLIHSKAESWITRYGGIFQHPVLDAGQIEFLSGSTYRIEVLVESKSNLSEKLCIRPVLNGGMSWGV
ncbi:MAG: hypothetical protein VKL39_11495 [Leptolyngbyaceae bacterium]|nr:hypothetical protein [Leptolyngbyaceae bacterium]